MRMATFAIRITVIRSGYIVLLLPHPDKKIVPPENTERGTASPVRAAVFTILSPLRTIPSTGTFSPALMRRISSIYQSVNIS